MPFVDLPLLFSLFAPVCLLAILADPVSFDGIMGDRDPLDLYSYLTHPLSCTSGILRTVWFCNGTFSLFYPTRWIVWLSETLRLKLHQPVPRRFLLWICINLKSIHSAIFIGRPSWAIGIGVWSIPSSAFSFRRFLMAGIKQFRLLDNTIQLTRSIC